LQTHSSPLTFALTVAAPQSSHYQMKTLHMRVTSEK
jgi:hypothetical protein